MSKRKYKKTNTRKTNKIATWKKVVTIITLLSVGALVAVGIIHTHKHWDKITSAFEKVVEKEPAEAVELKGE